MNWHIELWNAHGTLVVFNTVMSSQNAIGFFSSIDSRFEGTSVTLANNIVRQFTERSSPITSSTTNFVGLNLDLFVDADLHDFHLRSDAVDVVGQGIALTVDLAGVDIDGEPRASFMPNRGADEF